MWEDLQLGARLGPGLLCANDGVSCTLLFTAACDRKVPDAYYIWIDE